MLICQAAEIKEGLFGQEEYSLTDGTIKDYIFRQFDIKEQPKTCTVSIPEQPKTPLQESVEEIQEWQKVNKWGSSRAQKKYLAKQII
jgi:hypothetical protein